MLWLIAINAIRDPTAQTNSQYLCVFYFERVKEWCKTFLNHLWYTWSSAPCGKLLQHSFEILVASPNDEACKTMFCSGNVWPNKVKEYHRSSWNFVSLRLTHRLKCVPSLKWPNTASSDFTIILLMCYYWNQCRCLEKPESWSEPALILPDYNLACCLYMNQNHLCHFGSEKWLRSPSIFLVM